MRPSRTPATRSTGRSTCARALQVSSDVYFYTLGGAPGRRRGRASTIQDWADKLGLGNLTGIDLPAEGEGLVPTPDWRNDLYREDLTDRPWSVGDNINLAVGPGRPAGRPAAAGGRLRGARQRRHGRHPARRPSASRIPAGARDPGDRPAAAAPGRYRAGGRASRSWTASRGRHGARAAPPTRSSGSFPIDIAGKTGTAERADAALERPVLVRGARALRRPEDRRRVTIERGGFGADSAAPAASAILTSTGRTSVKPGQIDEAAATRLAKQVRCDRMIGA